MTGGDQAASKRPQTTGNAGRKGGALSAAFYARPAEYLHGNIVPIADGLRSLPDHQLNAELEQLQTLIASGAGRIADVTMLAIYRAEVARRGDPELQFDVVLDLALERVERSTNAEDRAFITDVGKKLFALGGKAALNRAYDRMVALARPKMSDRRKTMLGNRWAGLVK